MRRAARILISGYPSCDTVGGMRKADIFVTATSAHWSLPLKATCTEEVLRSLSVPPLRIGVPMEKAMGGLCDPPPGIDSIWITA